MNEILIIAERDKTIINRLFQSGESLPSDHQIPYYLPTEDAVNKIFNQMKEESLIGGNKVELIWIDTIEDVKAILQRISSNTVFLPLIDGFWPFAGTPIINLIRSFGGIVFGSGPSASGISQNKFTQFSILKSLKIPTPETIQYTIGASPLDAIDRFIVKPIDMGNYIGIFDDGVDCDWEDATQVAQRVQALYGRQAIIQEYIDGLYTRASFVGKTSNGLDVGVHTFPEDKEGHIKDKWVDFENYFKKYSRCDAVCNTDVVFETIDESVKHGNVSQKAKDNTFSALARLVKNIDLGGIFTVDIIIREDTPYFLEINTNPFFRNVALNAYCQEKWGCDVISAIYREICS